MNSKNIALILVIVFDIFGVMLLLLHYFKIVSVDKSLINFLIIIFITWNIVLLNLLKEKKNEKN